MFRRQTQGGFRVGRSAVTALIGALAVSIGSAFAGDDPLPLRRFSFKEPHMGTEFSLILYTSDDHLASRASRAAFDRIHAIDAALTDYDPNSELMKLCAQAGGPPVPVGPDLFAVLSRAKELHDRSGGAFDPSIAPVVRLWRRARREKKLPDPALLAKAMALVGGDAIKLDRDRPTVELTRPGMKLDLGGIAKGYASGEAIAALKREGVTSALVAGSGDIVVSDPPPGRPGWTIGIAPLEAEPQADGSLGRTITLSNAAVSTSGDAEQFVEIGGKHYSHVVDPKTGLGLTDRRSVTVVAPEGALADALDTTACVLGLEQGMALIESYPQSSALFVQITPQGPVVTESKGWREHFTSKGH